jgi:hypothetical protein
MLKIAEAWFKTARAIPVFRISNNFDRTMTPILAGFAITIFSFCGDIFKKMSIAMTDAIWMK